MNVNNEGNITDTYSLSFQSPDNELIFEKAAGSLRPGHKVQQAATAYVEIRKERFQVRAGERGTYSFRRLGRDRSLGTSLPIHLQLRWSPRDARSVDLPGQVNAAGLLPFWIVPVGAGAFLLLCILLLIPLWNIPTSACHRNGFLQYDADRLYTGTDSDGDGLPTIAKLRLAPIRLFRIQTEISCQIERGGCASDQSAG